MMRKRYTGRILRYSQAHTYPVGFLTHRSTDESTRRIIVSSAAEGWYVDPSTGTNLRYWNGITWTDEVAPLPEEVPKKRVFAGFDAEPEAESEAEPVADTVVEPVADPVVDTVAEPAADTVADTVAEPAPDPWTEPAAEPAAVPPAAVEPAAPGIPDIVIPPLDAELEHTRLTRRELRARRGENPDLNDAPKHLPPMVPPAAGEPAGAQAPEEVEISIADLVEHPPVAPMPSAVPPQGAAPGVSAPTKPGETKPDETKVDETRVDETRVDETEFNDPEVDDPRQRRTRIVRLSVLLGILAVVSSVGVLTAGTL
jgi:hypothetical protein